MQSTVYTQIDLTLCGEANQNGHGGQALHSYPNYWISLLSRTCLSRLANGTWIGMIGQLMAQDGHIGIAGTALDEARSRVVDFSPYIISWDSGLLIKTSYGGLTFSHAYLSEFTELSWMLISLGYLALGVPILIILYGIKFLSKDN